ncbi:MAG TPA: hypothetical protein D7H85_04655 [Candidatus Poseidoniales archaeon]|nr:MAG TPA: hypothetical protein D7H85_04655 [Candidatus Poseidoniales archaeon]
MRSFGSSRSATGDHVPWSIIETTADMGLRIEDTVSWPETIEHAIHGLQTFALISESDIQPRPSESIRILRTGSGEIIDFERDLVRVLDEIVYRNDVQDEWIVRAEVSMDELSYTISPHVIDASEVVRSVEVKAITRHGLCVNPPDEATGMWYAQVILDL